MLSSLETVGSLTASALMPLPKSTIRLSESGKMLCGRMHTILLNGNLKVSVTEVIEIFDLVIGANQCGFVVFS